ncbi:zona pellucida sperm-binding protein 3-like [Cheilinus undulatus]|uniref:zona pellucida sperm-binding protein 3-like n=1 Tax=Cheilinus undulatus TaxID=241271 RepID=UPI001BD32E5A|nr:zona pellucida sperm-binding protein 3-like [Cheilinus undulatus]
MDRNLKINIILYVTFIISVSTLTESRLVYSLGGSSSINPNKPSRTHGDIQAQHSDVKRQQSAQPRPLVVNCYPDSMEVVVQADMFDTGLQVEGRNLHLGSDTTGQRSSCGAGPSGEAEFTIRTKLMDCGTKLSSNKEKIIYSNVLVYSPEPSHDGLLRLDGVSIPVECHYKKKYAVDGISLLPTWVPSVSTASAEDQIDFTLLLMTDDWQFERGSYSYFLGDPIRIQVSAIVRKHIPLRVYVDHCVATPTPDAHKTLRYDFIEHNGCLADAYLTNSKSHFLPRLEEHKLRFQLDAFKFYQENSNRIYITCHVKAVPVGLAVSSQTRACSFTENSWRSIDGNDQACRSCDITHRAEKPPPTELPTAITSTKAQPFMNPQRSLVQKLQEHSPSTFVRVRPGMRLRGHIKPQYSSAGIMKRGAEQTIQTGPITILQTSKTDTRPTDSKTF